MAGFIKSFTSRYYDYQSLYNIISSIIFYIWLFFDIGLCCYRYNLYSHLKHVYSLSVIAVWLTPTLQCYMHKTDMHLTANSRYHNRDRQHFIALLFTAFYLIYAYTDRTKTQGGRKYLPIFGIAFSVSVCVPREARRSPFTVFKFRNCCHICIWYIIINWIEKCRPTLLRLPFPASILK